MKRALCVILILLIIIILPISCDVHEWPDIPKYVKVHLVLGYDTDFMEWNHLYDGKEVIEKGIGKTYDNCLKDGRIRYIVRAYPISEKQRTAKDHTHEFIFYRSLSEGYDHEVTLDMIPGNYNIMVWSDMVKPDAEAHFHDAGNFAEIRLIGEHTANTDHRDAFRGTGSILLTTGTMEQLPDTLDILMQRPLAKYELIATDLQEFMDKEIEYLTKEAETKGEAPPTKVNMEDYKVVFHYSGFMPDVYNLHADKPVDSATGVLFESKPVALNDNEAALGFDYVFVNGKESAVTVQIGLYHDKDDRQLALSDPIDVPLRRSRHTIIQGAFMTHQASGGIIIDPGFDGNHNIIIE